MRPADTWVDYELIDATNHNRLERWGKTLLIRPDPQIIWKNEEVSPLWARADAIYYRSATGGGQWDYHWPPPLAAASGTTTKSCPRSGTSNGRT